jgi:hypothetical protein
MMQRQFTGLALQRKHWCRQRTRQTDFCSETPCARFHSGLRRCKRLTVAPGSGGQFVDTATRRSTVPAGDESVSTDPATPSLRLAPPVGRDRASLEELRREWRRLYHSDPPRLSRDLLIRGIGYRLQEIEHGGLGKSTRRKLKTLAKMFRCDLL